MNANNRKSCGAGEVSFFPFVRYVLVAVVLLFSSVVWANEVVPPINPEGYRDQAAHARYHQLYQKMHNQENTHCCNAGEKGGDCRPTTARWNEKLGQWEAKLDGRWIMIPSSKHVKDAYGLNEFATVCASETSYLYCFIPPNNGY